MHIDIVGRSPRLLETLRQAKAVARTTSTVLIQGDTGTGKELIANVIHDWSDCRSGRLVKVSVAAIPAALVESELFGYEKGAFTGATSRRAGRVELAQDGTLFLDEIGEMPIDLQPKLLRFIQEREYERLGSGQTQRSNARLVVATNRDLGAMVDAGVFREDLYYRLDVFAIRVPPLRERPEDIPALARAFVEVSARKLGRSAPEISTTTMDTLVRYCWPGNVRQLQNVIDRAVILATGALLELDLPLRVPAGISAPTTSPACGSIDDAIRAHIVRALTATDWVIGGPRGAAVELGMKRSTLNFRIKKLGITRPRT